MKITNSINISIIIVYLFSISFSLSVSADYECLIVKTKSIPLNIRSSPIIGITNKIGTANKGSALRILEIYNKDWLKIKLNDGKIGYAYSKFTGIGNCAVSKKDLNVRPKPSINNNPIFTLRNGSAVRILDKGTYWSKVLLNNGTIGYSSNHYLKWSNDHADNKKVARKKVARKKIDHYVAFAYYHTKVFSYTADSDTKLSDKENIINAQNHALFKCNASKGMSADCKVIGWSKNACGSVAIDTYGGIKFGEGSTKQEAERNALNKCNTDYKNCQSAHTTCTN